MSERTYIWNGQRVTVEQPGAQSQIVLFVDDPDWDLTDEGDYTELSAPRDIWHLVIHWGDTTAEETRDTLRDRGLSTHFIVEGDTIRQVLDLEKMAWHTKPGNKHSIGIDIGQWPIPRDKLIEFYRNRGMDIEVVENPSPIDPDEIISLDPTTERTVAELLIDLHMLSSVPLTFPKVDGELFFGVMTDDEREQYRGIVGHNNFTKGKTDPGAWMEGIERATRERLTDGGGSGGGGGGAILLALAAGAGYALYKRAR